MELLNPIHKDGSINDPNNYRGICISSALLKIICTLLNNRIQLYCTKLNLINKNQIGFKKKHRTSDHLFTLKAVVKKYVTMGKKKLFTCFVDFKKAYDSVWHKGLFYKINNIGIFGKSLDLIKDIYNKTKCAVKINNSTTNYFNYTKGVRQGCPLSPILFNLYINDIFDIMNNDIESNIFLKDGEKINMLMYADDLILLSESKEGLQKQINKLNNYCKQWKLDVNVKKTKIMIFNRGNKIINTEFYINNTPLQNVKIFKYLGFTISAKNCSFSPTLDDLSLKASRAVYTLNGKIKLSTVPTKLALQVFKSQIMPILLYGSEVWGPYMDFNYTSWEKSKIERIHTQYIKRILGCNIQTSNLMCRGEVGSRPLLLEILKRSISYRKSVIERESSIVNTALEFETQNDSLPNFCHFVNNFNVNNEDFANVSKYVVNKKSQDNYDRIWWTLINESPKADAYVMVKRSIFPEKYLFQVKNLKHKLALSRFRLSSHLLMIEKGRHMRPRIERNERKCFICNNDVEDEIHFLIKCPLYDTERVILFQACRDNSMNFDSLETNEQKFVFILSNENASITVKLASFIWNAFKVRDKALTN